MNSKNRQYQEMDKIVYVRPCCESEFRDELAPILRYTNEKMGEDWITPDTLDRICKADRNGACGSIPVTESKTSGIQRQIKLYYDIKSQTDRFRALKAATEATKDDNIQSLVVADAEAVAPGVTDIIFAISKRAMIHLVNPGLTLHISNRDEQTERALRVLAGLDAVTDEEAQQIDTSEIGYRGGRPPLGYTAENGSIVRDGNYETVVKTLKAVKNEGLSKRKAAENIGCARATIGNALDRPELYF